MYISRLTPSLRGVKCRAAATLFRGLARVAAAGCFQPLAFSLPRFAHATDAARQRHPPPAGCLPGARGKP